jgi:hypothetical protein
MQVVVVVVVVVQKGGWDGWCGRFSRAYAAM